MKKILLSALTICSFSSAFQAQPVAQKIYETEKAFEKAVAEKGMNQAFIEFSAPDGICFMPGFPVNCVEYFKTQKTSPAALFWNPTFIDVSSNGAMAYSVGNSIYKAKGKDDTTAYYGHYASVWQRQPDGNFRAVSDIGISHDKPANIETKWLLPADSGKELNEKKSSAADYSLGFSETATKQNLAKAYKSYLADDAIILREGKFPLSKKDALEMLKKDKSSIKFARRSVFSSAADMAYTTNSYTIADKKGKEIEKGNFLQVWKLRAGVWQIVLDVFLPTGK